MEVQGIEYLVSLSIYLEKFFHSVSLLLLLPIPSLVAKDS